MYFIYESSPGKRRTIDDCEINRVTVDILIEYYESRKRLGIGTYVLNLYQDSGEMLELCSGILSNIGSDLDSISSEYYVATINALKQFHSANADDSSPVLAHRDKEYSFLRIRTSTGYICGVYHDTNIKARTGLSMLMVAAFVASRYYMNTDDVLRKNISRMLEDEDLPLISPKDIESLIRRNISKKSVS